MTMSLRNLAAPMALCLCVGVSGCGTTPGDRAVSGGLLGAGTGAVIGSLAGGVGEGALIGGVGGALIGAVTSPDSLYMGEPPWHHHYSRNYHRHSHHRYYSKACDSNTCPH
jgi:osmotically inducible lipoprotein OsmB